MSVGRVLEPEDVPHIPVPPARDEARNGRLAMSTTSTTKTVPAERGAPAQADEASSGRVAMAGAWGLLGRGLMLVVNLLATPFTIRLLGPARYGLWSVLQSALSLAAASDVSMGPATTKLGADQYARRDAHGESAVVWTAVGITIVTTMPIAITLTIFAPEVLRLFNVHTQLVRSGVLALRVGCSIFMLQSVAGILSTSPQVRLEWRAYTLISTSSNLIASVGPPVALALFSGGLVTASFVVLASSFLMAAGTLFLAVRFQPQLRLPRFDKTIMKQLLRFGGPLTVATVLLMPLMTAERLFLASNHSTTVVAYWAVAATLATTLVVLPEQLVGPLMPALARLETEGAFTEVSRLFHRAMAGIFLIATPMAVLLALIAQPFLAIWAGPQYGVHSTTLLLIAIPGVWLDCFNWVCQTYLISSGRPKVIAYLRGSQVIPYLLAAWVLTDKFGATGAALVWSGRLVVETLVLFRIVRRAGSLRVSLLSERKFASIAGPLVLCGAAAAIMVVSHGFIVRIGFAVGLGALYAIACWRLILTRRERQGILGLMDEALRRGASPRRGRRST